MRLAVAQPKNPGGEQSGISRYEAPRPPPSPSPASEAATESLARDFDPRLLLGEAPTATSPPPPAPTQPPPPVSPRHPRGLTRFVSPTPLLVEPSCNAGAQPGCVCF